MHPSFSIVSRKIQQWVAMAGGIATCGWGIWGGAVLSALIGAFLAWVSVLLTSLMVRWLLPNQSKGWIAVLFPLKLLALLLISAFLILMRWVDAVGYAIGISALPFGALIGGWAANAAINALGHQAGKEPMGHA
ncbi:MAG: hypothetical protein NZM37_06765 [Sandaracinaceae bacterium]|nr:hypothetical protein [Sandaracinaceae bacterium]